MAYVRHGGGLGHDGVTIALLAQRMQLTQRDILCREITLSASLHPAPPRRSLSRISIHIYLKQPSLFLSLSIYTYIAEELYYPLSDLGVRAPRYGVLLLYCGVLLLDHVTGSCGSAPI